MLCRYATKEEALYRAGIFAATKALQDEHNARYAAGEETWFMSLNPFSDLTHAEFRAAYTGGKRTSAGRLPAPPAPESAAANPTSVDWRTKGAVTPVKDQGQCGSCWAFATTVATEGSTYLGSNSTKLISLSEEQILACDTKDGNAACNGGDQLPAMQWLMTVPGQCSEADYPYTSGGGNSPKTCKTTCAPAAVITAAFEVPKEDQTALETAIAGRPISLSVDASSNAWQNYGGGVCECPGALASKGVFLRTLSHSSCTLSPLSATLYTLSHRHWLLRLQEGLL